VCGNRLRILKRLMALRGEWCMMQGVGWKRLVSNDVRIILKCVLVWPVEGMWGGSVQGPVYVFVSDRVSGRFEEIGKYLANVSRLSCSTWGGMYALMV